MSLLSLTFFHSVTRISINEAMNAQGHFRTPMPLLDRDYQKPSLIVDFISLLSFPLQEYILDSPYDILFLREILDELAVYRSETLLRKRDSDVTMLIT